MESYRIYRTPEDVSIHLQDIFAECRAAGGFQQKMNYVCGKSMDRKIRVAVLDLYDGQPNEGMRCLREILKRYALANLLDLEWDEFEVRQKQEIPDLSYTLYISTGGPGSPLDSENSEWEIKYFNWIREVLDYNKPAENLHKKHVLFICHSFQLACRYFGIAKVTKRRSSAFGVFPVHIRPGGIHEPIFAGLRDPFFAVDSRDYQVIQPDSQMLRRRGSRILAIEKERPHVPLERAVMAIRFNNYMVGTQFHPEADAAGMSMYLQRKDKKSTVIAEHGEKKWSTMIEQLNDPDKILWTHDHVIPNFLNHAIPQFQEKERALDR
jgi:homoserine O-succinyltransferase